MSPKMSVMQCKKQFHVILFYATFAYIRKSINPSGLHSTTSPRPDNRPNPVKTQRKPKTTPRSPQNTP